MHNVSNFLRTHAQSQPFTALEIEVRSGNSKPRSISCKFPYRIESLLTRTQLSKGLKVRPSSNTSYLLL